MRLDLLVVLLRPGGPGTVGGNKFALPEANGHQCHFGFESIERQNAFFFESLDGAIGKDTAHFAVVRCPQLFGVGHDTRFDGPAHDFEGKRVKGVDTRVLCLCEPDIEELGSEWGGRRQSVVRGELVHGIDRSIIALKEYRYHTIDLQKNLFCYSRHSNCLHAIITQSRYYAPRIKRHYAKCI